MISSPASQVGTPAVKRLTVLQAWRDIGPVHDRPQLPVPTEPSLPPGLDQARPKLAPGWSWRIVCGQGHVEGTAPAPPPDPNVRNVGRREVVRKTIDVQIPVGSVTLRCVHVDGRRGVAGWVWRTDKEAWSFSGPAYAWTAPITARPYECSITEWVDLMAWDEMEMAA